jgi:tetratricopeptide (TPR) repeat protein
MAAKLRFIHSRGPSMHPARRAGVRRAAPWLATLVAALALLALAAPRGGAAPSPEQGSVAHAPASSEHSAPARSVIAAPAVAPSGFSDLAAWLEYKNRTHLAALPMEARIFYRQGIVTWVSGGHEEALRLVRGAAELDPAFVGPHLTMASWFLLRDPGQALQQWASALDLLRQNFALQLALLVNLGYLAFRALFLGLLAAGVLLVLLHQARLRHTWKERLAIWLSPRTAAAWSWAFLILPFFLGFGVGLPTVAMLGLLWSHLKVRERAVFVALTAMLATAPWTLAALDRFSGPLRDDRAPYYGTPLLQSRPDGAQLRPRITGLAAREPDNAFLQFASGWLARRDGDLHAAEAAYRRVQQLWPQDDRALNNLGNVLASEGRTDEALACYQRATSLDPTNAAAHFNASQLHTLRFDYHDATDELSRASALNFEMVKNYQGQGADDGWLPLVDQWISPDRFWADITKLPSSHPDPAQLPPGWRPPFGSTDVRLAFLALAAAILGAIGGRALQRRMPLRACNNCGRIVCRRCAERRRERALCASCAALDSSAESPEFGRMLLLKQQRRVLERQRWLRTGLAALIPGYGLLALRRALTPVVLLTTCAALVAASLGPPPPVWYEPRLLRTAQDVPLPLVLGVWFGLYLVSLLAYASREAHERAAEAAAAAPVTRGRFTPASSHLRNAA